MPDHALLRCIGRGSYGEVWLARNIMGTLRAVKIVYRHTFEDSHPFEREFAGIQRYEPISRSHEGLVQVLHVGRSETGDAFYYVMELADDARTGPQIDPVTYAPKTVRSEIVQHGRVPLDECIRVSLSLASALGHLHQQGLLHRDLKPSNIIFVNGRPKLADIGLVSELGESRSFVGTEGFIPPEGPGSPQADIYSLGKVLYELSTGKDRQQFPELPAEWLELSHEELQLEFHEILLKACEGQRDKRYKSAEELHAELALLRSGKSVRKLHAMERRVKVLTRAGMGAVALAALALAGYLIAERQTRIARQNTERIGRAERETRLQLVNVYLAQARAEHRTGQSGHKLNALAAVAKGAELLEQLRREPGSSVPDLPEKFRDFRNEAGAALALTDIAAVEPVPVPTNAPWQRFDFAAGYQQWPDKNGDALFRKIGSEEIITLSCGVKVSSIFPFSSDGTRVPVLYKDRVLRVWDFRAKKIAVAIPSKTSGLALEWTPDDSAIAINFDNDRLISFHDPTTGAKLREIITELPPNDFRFSPNGKHLAVYFYRTNFIDIFELLSDARAARLMHPGRVGHLNWHRGGALLAAANSDFKVYVWNAPVGELVRTLATHQAEVMDVAFHPDGQSLASTSWDGTTRIFETATGRPLVTMLRVGQRLQFNRDGTRLLIDQLAEPPLPTPQCETLSTKTFSVAKEPDPPGAGSSKGPWSVHFSPNGQLLASSSYDGVRVWDAATLEVIQHFSIGEIFSVLFRPDGRRLVATGIRGLFEWNVQGSSNGFTFEPVQGAFQRTGFKKADFSTNEVLAFVDATQVHVRRGEAVPQAFAGSSDLHYATISRDGTRVAAAPLGRPFAYVLDAASGKRLYKFPTVWRANLAFTPESKWLVTGDTAEFCFWNLETGQADRRIKRMDAESQQGPLAFSADGRLLALAINRTRIQLREYPSLRELITLEAPDPQMISWLCFDQAGERLAVACETHLIQVWNLKRLRGQMTQLKLDWQSSAF